ALDVAEHDDARQDSPERDERLVRRGFESVETVASSQVAPNGVRDAVEVLGVAPLLDELRDAHVEQLLERDFPRRPRRRRRRDGFRPLLPELIEPEERSESDE